MDEIRNVAKLDTTRKVCMTYAYQNMCYSTLYRGMICEK